MDSQQPAMNADSKIYSCQGYRSSQLLYDQAYECGKRGQFDQAQRHINQAIRLYPTNIQGYLLGGELYSQQGKQQMAIDVYKRGVYVAAHEPDRQILRNHQALAKTRLETRIDFVRALFPDVVAAIFERMGELHNTRILLVSKAWREFILQVPSLWRSARCWAPFSINPTFRLLHTVNGYVHKVKLTYVSDKILKELLSMAQSGRLSRVNRIELKTEKLLMTLPLVFSLERNLSSLVIIESCPSDDTGTKLALDTILSKCQSLERLSLSTNRSISFDTTTTTTLKLRTFIVECRGDTNLVFQEIMRRSPHLQQFGTSNACSSETLSLLDQHCPHLKALQIIPNLEEIASLENFDDSNGLETLAVDDRNMFGPRDLIPFFAKSRLSLRSLTLELSYPRRIPQQEWTSLAALGPFPNMKSLYYSSSDRTAGTGFTAIPLMRQCPALETVVFDYIDMVSDLTVDTLMTLPRLGHLKIAHCDMSPRIEQFFQHHAEMGNASPLSHVTITYGNPLTDAILDALANVTTLQYIGIRGSADITKPGLKTFISKYCSHSDVKNLRLSDLRQVTGPAIAKLLRRYKRQ